MRQISVLSCELRWRERGPDALGDEAQSMLAGHFRQLVCRAVERYRGSPGPLLGRHMTCFFGVPEPCENSAERAVLVALELQRRIVEEGPDLAARWSVDWSVGIGLAAGQAMVGDQRVSGAPVEAAPSLAQIAPPGEVLASGDLARRLAGRYRFQTETLDLAATPVAGRAIEALRLIGPETSPADADCPMVGRVQELSILQQLVARAIEGRGQIVAVTGEAGVGKTRLLAELHGRLTDTRCLHWKARCRPYDEGPFSPWVELIRGAVPLGEEDPPEIVATKLRQHLRLIGVEELSPELLELLGRSEAPRALVPCAEALCRWIFAVSQQTPVILEVEDLQWLDPGTQAVLERLAEGLGHARLMLLVTYRADQARRILSLLGRSNATQIALAPLTEAESQTFAASLPDSAARVGSIQATLARAEGNPYCIREMLRSPAAGEEGQLPDSIRELMAARLGELSASARRLLQIAAVHGREFDVAQLEAVWPGPEPIEAPLAELRRRGLLLRAATGEPYLSFRHRLLHQTLYASLLPGRRQLLHAEIAAALDTMATEPSEQELRHRADHHRKAGHVHASLDDQLRFAEKASARGANDLAVEVLSEALRDAERLPADRVERRVAKIMRPLVEASFSVGRLRSILDLFEAHPGVLDRPEDTGQSGGYEAWRALTLSYVGQPAEAVRAAKRASALGRRARDESVQGRGRVVLGLEAFAAGDFEKGKEHGLKAQILLERVDDLWWLAQAQEVRAACDLALGRGDEALEALEAAEGIRSAINDWRLSGTWLRIYALGGLGEEGRNQALAASETLSRRCTDAPSRSLVSGALGVLHCRAGNWADAVGVLTQAVADFKEFGMRRHGGWFGAWLVRALALTDDERAARIALAAAEESLGDVGFVLGDGELERARWALARSRGEAAQARAHLDEAQAVWSRFGIQLEQELGARDGTDGGGEQVVDAV